MAAQLRPVAGRPDRGKPVIVIPGLLASDILTRPLRSALNSAGMRAFGWRQGIDSGARRSKFAGMLARIDAVSAQSGEKLAMVGWSLGGLYARELAKRRPEAIDLVVTLGTPFSHGLRRNNAWKLYEAINDHDVDHPPIPVDPPEKPRTYTIACWSPNDGIVAPASAAGEDGEVDERIELSCRHTEFVSDKQALATVTSRIAAWEH